MSKLDKVLVAKLAFLSDMYHTVYMLARGRFPFSRPAPRPPRPTPRWRRSWSCRGPRVSPPAIPPGLFL